MYRSNLGFAKHKLGRWAILTGLLYVAPVGEVLAAEPCEPWAAKIVSIEGRVEVSRIGEPRWVPARLKQTFCPGDRVRIESRSRAAVLLPNQTVLRLDERTALTFTQVKPAESSLLELLKGAIHFLSRTPAQLRIHTPFSAAGVEGTEFVLRVAAEETQLWVFEGRVRFANAKGSLLLASGEAAAAQAGRAPQRRVVVRPREAVQWALYYPPLIDYRLSSYPAGPDALGIREALKFYRQDDLTSAFASLDKVPDETRAASYYTLRAGLLLNVGRVNEARADIDQALRLDPKNATAYALQSVIAMVQNEQEQALYLARKAEELNPQSPIPKVALSYAYQAKFDIEKALENIEQAIALAPTDALAYARLAELQLSRGDLGRAINAAKTAVALDPDLARTQAVLGFAYLTEIDIDKAKASFQKAIELDPASPLPRLGLGLARIRDGDLREGTQEIEIAASLDPNNSLVRSYLGKAYFEEKRGGLASSEFEIAKALDPNDPTPWFYDAIHKQTTNRPVEALDDLQKAIELNDNRAVYRSSLLLDQDLAARSASVARIYRDLGFEQRALVEGWKSLDTDPANYSAHRLLADVYSALPRHEIARVSELLQSQLLQPLNITPVQPQLAEESNLLILEGAGPAAPAFNEFNPLFTRNRLALQASGVVGSNDTYGDEVVQSGIWNQFSYSLGQFHYETDGFRENNDLTQDIYNAFVQTAITPKLNLQAEFRHRETEQGDLELRFDPNNFFRNMRTEINQDTVRVGVRYSPLPHSNLIVSGIYTDRTEDLDRRPTFGHLDSRGYQVEARYFYEQDALNITLGGGTYDIDEDLRVQFPSRPDFISKSPQQHYNAYLYANLTFPRRITWTAGLSYDSIDSLSTDTEQLNPKLGLQWSLTDWIRLRLGYLQTLKRLLPVNETIEPTQVAGFNQFFDDENGAKTERYGVGLDAVLTQRLYGGIEYSRRNLEVPGISIREERLTFDRQEELARGYLYWTPYKHWAISGEAEFERFDRSATDRRGVVRSGGPTEVETVRVPLTVRYFHPSGFFSKLAGTFVQQDVDLEPGSTFTRDSDQFFLVDATIGYRLPRRLGIISLEARNLLDEEFLYQDLNVQTSRAAQIPSFIPDQVIFLHATLAFD